MSELTKLESISLELNNEHMRLIEKFKQLLAIFSSLSIRPTSNKKNMTWSFNKLEQSRNKIAHGQYTPTTTNNKNAFLETLIVMTKFIAMIQAGE